MLKKFLSQFRDKRSAKEIADKDSDDAVIKPAIIPGPIVTTGTLFNAKLNFAVNDVYSALSELEKTINEVLIENDKITGRRKK